MRALISSHPFLCHRHMCVWKLFMIKVYEREKKNDNKRGSTWLVMFCGDNSPSKCAHIHNVSNIMWYMNTFGERRKNNDYSALWHVFHSKFISKSFRFNYINIIIQLYIVCVCVWESRSRARICVRTVSVHLICVHVFVFLGTIITFFFLVSVIYTSHFMWMLIHIVICRCI